MAPFGVAAPRSAPTSVRPLRVPTTGQLKPWGTAAPSAAAGVRPLNTSGNAARTWEPAPRGPTAAPRWQHSAPSGNAAASRTPNSAKAPAVSVAAPSPAISRSVNAPTSQTGHVGGAREDCTLQMKHFPVAWVTPLEDDKLRVKIQQLLEKFGKLREAPQINETPSGIVAIASFTDRAAAKQAAKTLHGVDNRTEAEKRQCEHRLPAGDETFHVQLLSDDAVANNSPATAREAKGAPWPVAAGQASKVLRLADLPPEWTAQDIQELCSQYGPVDSVFPNGPGGFLVTFREVETATSASTALAGLQLQTESGAFSTLQCELVSEDVAADASDAALLAAPTTDTAGDEADEDADQLRVRLHEGGTPLVFYVDELQLSQGEPGVDDKEIFLRDLPLEDYTETQLRQWLDDFGSVNEVIFLKDPATKELSGRGYVRFASHEEAAGLIAAFPQTADDDGNVKGSWSLSERILRGTAGPYQADVVGFLGGRLRPLQQDLRCAALLMACDGREGPPELQELELQAGPLHFVCSRHHRMGTAEALSKYLGEILTSELESPGAAAAALAAESATSGATPNRRPSQRGNSKNAPTPTKQEPCIVVRGFPDSWQAHQVKMTFAIFGGVSSVRFVQDARARIAQVRLKIPENMQKAVDQLNNTQVGDGELIEECTILCRVSGVPGATAAPVSQRSIFVDELAMTARPDVKPGERDREVFLQNLPVRDCTEDQIRAWLEGFGQVDDVYLLKEPGPTLVLTGKGYVKFSTHDAAAACIEAQSSVADAEEGDVIAHWSESERALQRLESVYGNDVHKAFTQRLLDHVKKTTKVNTLVMFSGNSKPKDPESPKPEATQLHFVVADCTDAQFADVRNGISKLLVFFHRSTSKTSTTSPFALGKKTPSKAADAEKADATPRPAPATNRRENTEKDASATPTPPQPSAQPSVHRGLRSEAPPAAPAAPPPPGSGQSPQHGGPADWQGYWQGRGMPLPGAPPRGPWGAHPAEAAWQAGFGKGASAPGHPWSFPAHPWHGCQGQPPPGPAPTQPAASQGGTDRVEDDQDSSVQSKIEKGEALVKEAKKLVESKGDTKKAYEKYCRGLQSLLGVMSKLPEDDRSAADLRVRVDGYLEEAERLKGRIDGEAKLGSSTTPGSAGSRTPRGDRERGEEKGPAGGDRPSNVHAGKKDGKAEESAEKKARSEGGPFQARLDRGHELIDEGKIAEEKGLPEEAYQKFCRGLQYILEVLPQLGEDPQVAPLRVKVSSYLERAEKLKEKLESMGAKGPEKPRLPQEPSKRPGANDRSDRGSATSGARDERERARSRDRQRNKHRSRSRSRRHGGHGRSERHRSRSRSRGGASRKESGRSGSDAKPHRSGGSGPPAKAPGFGDLASEPQVEATRPKAVGSARPPPPPSQPVMRPKSGASLLVGKAKASAKSRP
eukprot:TRINITY_DN29274_c0_g1_i1.p1 TRINITY_DN29274_c0_g1~~TRINITY_DN29274_c0_g1_i1.p1  ORF type:complete len:1422 (-),score=291.29 TRINITY_DN29274_c0_g1_i1:126-4391(-)